MRSHINVGMGDDVSIRQLARLGVVGLDGEIALDASKPDGAPRKLLDSSRLRSSGSAPNVSLYEGLDPSLAREYALSQDGR